MLIKQCDPKWGKMKIGNQTCCQIGCVTTGLSWLSNWYGKYVSPDKAIPKLKYTASGLLYWTSVDSVFPFKFVYRYYKRDDKKILEILKSKDGSCELQVNYGKHWVVLVGYSRIFGYKIFDPFYGDVVYLADRYGDKVYGFTEFTRK
jgi:hypothetical protein